MSLHPTASVLAALACLSVSPAQAASSSVVDEFASWCVSDSAELRDACGFYLAGLRDGWLIAQSNSEFACYASLKDRTPQELAGLVTQANREELGEFKSVDVWAGVVLFSLCAD